MRLELIDLVRASQNEAQLIKAVEQQGAAVLR
jgi:hypothetical protein